MERIIPNSEWVKVDYEDDDNYYVLGLIYDNDTIKYRKRCLKMNNDEINNKIGYEEITYFESNTEIDLSALNIENPNRSDYQKIKATHDYLCNAFVYSYFHDGPFDAFFKGTTDCEGYAMTFQMVMDYCNIPCKYIGYFQARTNTYADLETLKNKYEEVFINPSCTHYSTRSCRLRC